MRTGNFAQQPESFVHNTIGYCGNFDQLLGQILPNYNNIYIGPTS